MPHICEEAMGKPGHSGGIEASGWPSFSGAEAAVEDELLIVVHAVNGKLRGKSTVEASAAEDDVKAAALNVTSEIFHGTASR